MDIAPDGGLRMGAAIAQGAQNFVTAFQNARSMQLNYQLKQQELESQNELRKLQMAKLRSELEPTTVDFQKVAAAKQLMMGGYVDQKFYENTVRGAMDNIKTPTQAQFLNSTIQKDLMNRGAPSTGSVQSRDINAPAPGANPDLMRTSSSRAGGFNAPVQLNKAERELLEKSIGYQTTANVAAGRNQNNLDMQDLRNKGAQDLHALESEFKFKLEQIQSEQRNRELQAKIQAEKDLQAQKDKAAADRERMGINAGKYRSRAGGASDKEVGRIDAELKKISEQRGKLDLPNGMGMMLPPFQAEAAKKNLDERYQQLLDQRDVLTGKKKASAPAQQAAPKASSGIPELKSQQDVANFPIGKPFILNGKTYQKLDAEHVDEVK